MRIAFIFIILLISCSKSDNRKNNTEQVLIPTSINSFFNNTPSTIKLDSTYLNTIDKWISIISFSQKFNDLIDKEINHKSKISSLAVDLNKINKDNMPVEFKISPIIGRLRVLKTFILKIDSYLLRNDNLDEYTADSRSLLESYNALIYQINLRAKEIS